MIQLPLSITGPADTFSALVVAHCAALAAHRTGKAGIPAPVASVLVDSLVARVWDIGPVATRGPDTFMVVPYEIVDDTPKAPDVSQALSVLRETLA